MNVRWLKRAIRDLTTIRTYIAQDDPAAAAEAAQRIIDATGTLSKFPAAGRPGRIPGTRELIVSGTPFLLPYRVREDVVEVLRVLHAARRWPETETKRGRRSPPSP